MSGTAPFKDYYYILGVHPSAGMREIQQAYQDLYDKFGPHVTLTGIDPEAHIKAFKDINEAWETLSDPRRRRQYDESNKGLFQKSDLKNLWNKVTGTEQMPKQDAPTDIRVVTAISLREAAKGCQKDVMVEDRKPCPPCLNLKPMDRARCLECRGAGFTRVERQEVVSIPAGVVPGQEFRFPGKGKADPKTGRSQGELIVEIAYKEHPYIRAEENDLHITVPVTVYEAVLGGEIEVPTATGKVAMKIQPLSQQGRVYRLKGLGLAGGDFLVTLEVIVPKTLSSEEVILFRKLAENSSQENPRTDMLARSREA